MVSQSFDLTDEKVCRLKSLDFLSHKVSIIPNIPSTPYTNDCWFVIHLHQWTSSDAHAILVAIDVQLVDCQSIEPNLLIVAALTYPPIASRQFCEHCEQISVCVVACPTG